MNLIDLIDENGKLVIPEGVTKIESQAFSDNDNLTAVEIPDSVTEIGDFAFGDCSKLISVTIPDSVTNIGEGAFIGFESLSSIIVSDNNTKYKSIGNCCLSKDGDVLIFGCKNSKIPNCVSKIGDSAFYGCRGLTYIEIPSSVTQIGNGAFGGCRGLTSIEIPSSVTQIGDHAFARCTGLTSIEIPNNLTVICCGAFAGCTGLTSIEIPAWIVRVDGAISVFYPFENLSSITVRITEKLPDNAKDVLRIVDHLDPSIVTLKVPAGCGEAYRHHPDFEGKFKEILEVLD